jgi:hydroxymethylbilane synthase
MRFSLWLAQVDLCVHSMKDVPTWLPLGTILPCYLPREETNDVFLSLKYKSLQDLPNGAIIGSASLRRQAQLLSLNPTFNVINFRGNVQTRLKKLENQEVDATLLALAGLKRLQMDSLIHSSTSQILSHQEMLPAVSQGAIGLQCRENDLFVRKLLEKLNDRKTEIAVCCERAFLETLDGNCRTPIAGQATVSSDEKRVFFKGMMLKADGSEMVSIERSGEAKDHRLIGRRAGEELIKELGAEKFKEFQETFS